MRPARQALLSRVREIRGRGLPAGAAGAVAVFEDARRRK
jgi:hypothetical protein